MIRSLTNGFGMAGFLELKLFWILEKNEHNSRSIAAVGVVIVDRRPTTLQSQSQKNGKACVCRLITRLSSNSDE